MTEWTELHDPRMSEVFECLKKGGEAETRTATDQHWRQLKTRTDGCLVFRYHCMGLHLCATRQWRVREPEPKYRELLDPGACQIASLLDDGHRVQMSDDGKYWEDVLSNGGTLSAHGVFVTMGAYHRWRYQEKE